MIMINYSTNLIIVSILIIVTVFPVLIFGISTIETERKQIEDKNLEFSREIVFEKIFKN